MPRRLRFATGGYVYHVLKRAVGRRTLFRKDADYAAFEVVLREATEFQPMRLLAYCVLPNHWHLVLWPKGDGDLSRYVRWLTVTHTQRYHAHYHTAGTGPLYQGRFKSFPVQEGDHLRTLCRYVERNAVRAGLVRKAEQWPWSSLWHYAQGTAKAWLSEWPEKRPSAAAWLAYVNGVQTEGELITLHRSVERGSPYGEPAWTVRTAKRLAKKRGRSSFFLTGAAGRPEKGTQLFFYLNRKGDAALYSGPAGSTRVAFADAPFPTTDPRRVGLPRPQLGRRSLATL